MDTGSNLQKLKVPEEVSSKPSEKERGEKELLKNDAGKIDGREKTCGKKKNTALVSSEIFNLND